MRATTALPRFRARAETRMTSRVTVHRASARAAQNEATGRERRPPVAVATDIPFRLDGSSGDGGTRTVTVAGVEYQQATGVGHLPATFTDLRDNDVLEVTAGEWAGTFWRVVEAVTADQKTARRFPIAATTGAAS